MEKMTKEKYLALKAERNPPKPDYAKIAEEEARVEAEERKNRTIDQLMNAGCRLDEAKKIEAGGLEALYVLVADNDPAFDCETFIKIVDVLGSQRYRIFAGGLALL